MPDELPDPPPNSQFATTSWSVVLKAGGRDAVGKLAFEDLCSAYWYPLFAFARRKGNSLHDAEDGVQSFLTWLFESGVIERADPTRGRFRSFLIASFKHYLNNQHRHRTAQKRQPTEPVISINGTDGEQRYLREPTDLETPEAQFERAWALTVMHRATARLEADWTASGKGDRFQALKGSLTDDSAASGHDLAQQLQMTEGAVRVAIHRLKSQFAETLRQEVASTLDSEEDVDEELQLLIKAITGG